MTLVSLWPHQQSAIFAAEAEWARCIRSTLFVAPTASGKTRAFCALAERTKGRTIVLADQHELVKQAVDALQEHTRLVVGVEEGERRVNRKRLPRVVVASVQSITNRLDEFAPDAFALVVADEADRALAPTYRRIIDHFASARVFGCTATPQRGDGIALGELFETVCATVEVVDLVRDGYLAPIYAKTVAIQGIERIKTDGEDFDAAALDAIMRKEQHVHEVVSATLEAAGARPTLVFATKVAHARALAEVFNRHATQRGTGKAVAVWGTDAEREAKLEAFRRGEVQFVVNCQMLTRGVDLPFVSCLAMARPTQSATLYTQMLGRGMRRSPETGKRDCIVLDFVGATDAAFVVRSVDILGGKSSAEARERARELLDEEPGEVVEALDRAEEELGADPVLRQRVIAKVKARLREVETWWLKVTEEEWWTKTDAQISRESGVPYNVVNRRRPDHIPSPRGRGDELSSITEHDWRTKTNAQIVRETGSSRELVVKFRPAAIPSPCQRPDWSLVRERDWKTKTDAQIHKEMGYSLAAIRRNRPSDIPSPWDLAMARDSKARRIAERTPEQVAQLLALRRERHRLANRKYRASAAERDNAQGKSGS